MTLTLDATVGGATSNTYATLAEAESYFEARLHVSSWTAAATATKNAALAMATKALDRSVVWEGIKADEVQALQWPREYVEDPDTGEDFDSTAIPTRIKDAQCELALSLISEDRTLDSDGFKRIKAGSVEAEYASTDAKPVLPRPVRELLRDLGTFGGASLQIVPLVRS